MKDGGRARERERKERAENRIPVKASVRQDILLAVVIVEIRVEARHEGIDDTKFETRGRRMREKESGGGRKREKIGGKEERKERRRKGDGQEKVEERRGLQ